ncbi:MAG: Bacteriocin-protection, YdeI or OmpD-Associated, partial [Nocardioidaceae bacterium]|nr:Bacteriocin-protection, YdeI or OmpD-Associated [Nocardioidaceae bacterium]
GMAFTHRKEFARWVAEAKQEETRQRRAQQALEMIRSGKTRS